MRRCEHSRKKQQIVSHGSITLPAGAGPESFNVDKQVFKGQKLVEAHVSWSSNSSCVARMSIYSSEIASSRYEWCKVRTQLPHNPLTFSVWHMLRRDCMGMMQTSV